MGPWEGCVMKQRGRTRAERVAAVERDQTLLEVCRKRDVKLAAEDRASGAFAKRIGESGRLVRRVSLGAVIAAVRAEGREVLRPEGEGWWKDQERRHGLGDGSEGIVIAGVRNRFGKVTATFRNGKWEKRGR